MSAEPYSVRAELARAIRAVNVAYSRLDPDQRGVVEILAWDELEEALRSGSDDQALAAVAEWSHAQLAAIRAVAR
jgi:hypothetical protein